MQEFGFELELDFELKFELRLEPVQICFCVIREREWKEKYGN